MKTKKLMCILLCFMVITATAGCGSSAGSDGRNTSTQLGVEDVLQAGIAESERKTAPQTTESDIQSDDSRQSGLTDNAPVPSTRADESTVLSYTEGIDIDLTALSSTMVYSEVYNMMCEPEKYVGKTIKISGLFSAYHDQGTGQDYFACTIQDATACCAQGMEFVLSDDYKYPDDYPKEGGIITVVGTFETYMEGSQTYCTLKNAKLES